MHESLKRMLSPMHKACHTCRHVLTSVLCWAQQPEHQSKKQLQKEKITQEEFTSQLATIDKSLRSLPATAQVSSSCLEHGCCPMDI